MGVDTDIIKKGKDVLFICQEDCTIIKVKGKNLKYEFFYGVNYLPKDDTNFVKEKLEKVEE